VAEVEAHKAVHVLAVEAVQDKVVLVMVAMVNLLQQTLVQVAVVVVLVLVVQEVQVLLSFVMLIHLTQQQQLQVHQQSPLLVDTVFTNLLAQGV
jgi:NADH:ubiquinone oxidoreductase subunit K